MKRRTWWTWRIEGLAAELRRAGNTQEAWEALCDHHDLPAIAAGELAQQCGLRLQIEETSPLEAPVPEALQGFTTPTLDAMQVDEEERIWGTSYVALPEVKAEQIAENRRMRAALKSFEKPVASLKKYAPLRKST